MTALIRVVCSKCGCSDTLTLLNEKEMNNLNKGLEELAEAKERIRELEKK